MGDEWDWPTAAGVKVQNQTLVKIPLAIMLTGDQGPGKSLAPSARGVRRVWAAAARGRTGSDSTQDLERILEKSLSPRSTTTCRPWQMRVTTSRRAISNRIAPEPLIERHEKHLQHNRAPATTASTPPMFTSNFRDAGASRTMTHRRSSAVGRRSATKGADYLRPHRTRGCASRRRGAPLHSSTSTTTSKAGRRRSVGTRLPPTNAWL